MAKVSELNGMIHSKYKNESTFANALGWSRQRMNKITNGKKEPSLAEVEQISVGLNESFDRIAQIFLARSHQSGDY